MHINKLNETKRKKKENMCECVLFFFKKLIYHIKNHFSKSEKERENARKQSQNDFTIKKNRTFK